MFRKKITFRFAPYWCYYCCYEDNGYAHKQQEIVRYMQHDLPVFPWYTQYMVDKH